MENQRKKTKCSFPKQKLHGVWQKEEDTAGNLGSWRPSWAPLTAWNLPCGHCGWLNYIESSLSWQSRGLIWVKNEWRREPQLGGYSDNSGENLSIQSKGQEDGEMKEMTKCLHIWTSLSQHSWAMQGRICICRSVELGQLEGAFNLFSWRPGRGGGPR